jgi:asparagine synthase (glutamine-hydrolysing)
VLDADRVHRLVEHVKSSRDGQVPFPYNHAYLQVLSTLLLQESLVDDFEVPDVDVDRILLREFDGTGGVLVQR